MEQTLGKRIMTCRKGMGMTQDQLAEKLGVTAQAVSKWENDQSCPDISMLPKLAAIFGITTDALLGSPTQPQSEETSAKVHQAEVVDEDDEDDDPVGPGIRVQKGNWDFKWDSGKQGALSFAILVLSVGGQLLAAKLLQWDLGFWSILWPTGLMVFGLSGLIGKFSFVSLGMLLFGGYFLLDNWNLLPFSLGGELVFPAILVIFGVSLLVDALKKPNRPRFRVVHKGDKKNDYRVNAEQFDYSASFGEADQFISMPLLRSGKISTSFGEYTVDLSGVEAVSQDCCLEVSCSFGELNLLVPRRYAVKQSSHTAFGEISVNGHPDEQPLGNIHIKASASFGEITVKYI